MRLRRLLALIWLMLAVCVRPAFADATLFIGTSGVSDADNASRQTTKGFAIGAGLLVVGIEFEYAQTSEDEARFGPSLRTGVGNVYVQTPVPIAGLQFYGTTGGGLYRERSTAGTTADVQKTGFASNTGGGVKISLLGPLKARVDYRIFKLLGDKPRANWRGTVQRLYAGINLGF
jgi:outer membrane immunogenic protein